MPGDGPAHVLVIIRDGEKFVFLFQLQDVPVLLQHLGRLAADPESSFTWHEAAIVSNRARKLVEGNKPS